MTHPVPQGELFTDPSADAARAFFATKPRALTDKLTTVAEAVAQLVRDGDYLAIGGFGADRIPTAVLHEILRQGRQNLRFAGHTATHDFQILCAGNLLGRGKTLARVDIAYVVGLEARGLSPHARRVLESGEVEFTEWTNYALAVRFKAAAMGVPFLPARTMLGTDTFRRSGAREITCRLRGTTVADLDLARAAKRLIVTCERLIPHDEIRRDPSRTAVPFFCVDAVCEVPFGSYPGNMPYEYFSDEEHLCRWLKVERDVNAFRQFLDTYIYGVRDFAEYLNLCG